MNTFDSQTKSINKQIQSNRISQVEVSRLRILRHFRQNQQNYPGNNVRSFLKTAVDSHQILSLQQQYDSKFSRSGSIRKSINPTKRNLISNFKHLIFSQKTFNKQKNLHQHKRHRSQNDDRLNQIQKNPQNKFQNQDDTPINNLIKLKLQKIPYF